MPRANVTQADAIQAILDHLRTELSLEDDACFFVIDPLSFHIPRGDWWITVAAGDGTFNQELMQSGVIEQCTEDSTFVVTVYERLHLDPTDDDGQMLVRATEGLLPRKRLILKTLCGEDPLVGGNEFSRELITPQHCRAPMVVSPAGEEEGLQIGLMSITFGFTFDWDLTT